jgi:site-specific DNA-methyltransferase (adenine-specific)
MCWLEDETSFIFKQLITWNKINKGFNNTGFVHQRVSIDMMRNYYGGFTEYLLFYTFQDETGLTTVKLDLNNFTSLRQYFKDFQEALGLSLPEINKILGHRRAEHAFYWKSTQWELPTPETYQELCKLPLKNNEFVRREYEDLRREYEDLRYTFNITQTKDDFRSNTNTWLYPPTPKVNHITPKPLELVKNIIKHSSNTNQIILDPFMGSGTTAIAAKQLNRQYIGFEINQEYHQNIQKQLTNTEKPLTAF